MEQLSKNFNRSEFMCKCGCGLSKPSNSIVLMAQFVRDYFNQPVTITSGTRCYIHNTNVGGTKTSQHLVKDDGFSHAIDVQVKGVESVIVYKVLCKYFPNSLGLGLYKNWVHIDDRIDRAYRWNKTNG